MIKEVLSFCAVSMILVACSQIPKEEYYNRGEPESLLDVSSEVVNIKIDSPASIQQLTTWINQDQPTRAELGCNTTDALCEETQTILHQFGVPIKYKPVADNAVILVYERIVARDCENRYIDNTINPYNLNHPTFGCSLASNTVQMVSDKHQFTNPPVMGYTDGTKAVQTIQFYNQPNSFSPSRVDTDFQALATQQSLQTQGASSR